MPFKQLEIPEIGTVKLYKRRGNRSLRLSIAVDGAVRLSLPMWVPYATGLAFIKSRTNWINSQRQRTSRELYDKQAVGKAHHLYFVASNTGAKIKTRVQGSGIYVIHPGQLHSSAPEVQIVAQTAIKKAMKREADALLPQRLKSLADKHKLNYTKVSTRALTSRWGSCNSRDEIVLSTNLMILPWHLIDYVLLHELTHTVVKNHSPSFWNEFELHLPAAKQLRKEMKQFHAYGLFQQND